jgi:capsular polysaccharide biosynthesis protein
MRIIRKRGWIIVLVMALTAASALLFSRLQRPVYRSSIFLNVIPARLDWGLQQTIKGLMRNYAGQIKSRQTANEVIKRLQLDITPDDLVRKLTVSPIEADFLIQIDADDYDPLIARDVAQKTAEVFVERIKLFMLDQNKTDRVDVDIRDYALPGALHKPKWKVNTLAGAILGAILGGLIVFILQWLEADVIRTSDDAEHNTGVAVLAMIPTVTPTLARASRRHTRT